MSDHVKNLRSHGAYKWFESRKIKAFYNAVVTPTLRIGTQVLLQVLIHLLITESNKGLTQNRIMEFSCVHVVFTFKNRKIKRI